MPNGRAGRVVIVGAGLVGSTFAYSLMINGVVSEIVMIDIDMERLDGEVADLNHGIAFVRPVLVRAGTYADCTDADIILISAGVKRKPGESRIDLSGRNAAIIQSIIEQIKASGSNAILLVTTNPVDIMTYITYKFFGYPAERVIGSGTVLDTARFRYLISRYCKVNPSNIHAYIIGEHGDTEVPVWSLANIAGLHFSEYCPVCGSGCSPIPKDQIFNEVKNAGARIINGKGATYYAIGLALVEIVESILRDEHSILTVSSLVNGEYGIDDICLSLPSIVSRQGIEKKILLSLAPEEEEALRHSARTLREIIGQLKI